MALIKTGYLASVLILTNPAGTVFAQDADALSHSDGISLSGGDSSRANIAIQTPTPWPKYLNDFDYDMPGQQGVDLMNNYLNKFAAPAQNTGNTTININPAK